MSPVPRLLLVFSLVAGALAAATAPRAAIPVVVSPVQPSTVRLAAQDLAAGLARVYSDVSFPLVPAAPASGRCIRVGATTSEPALATAAAGRLVGPESYVVSIIREGERETAMVIGTDARGAAYGVYALLRRVGCGFTISGDTFPAPRKGDVSFAGWEFADHPLTPERLVFDWHNFLSGCSAWNLGDWKRWTDQAQKLGFNAIMVHAYGNNPMAGFRFNGREKPLGWLSTTFKGRDWATQHVNDVRRLWGGEVFDRAAFGADAGMVPDAERASAAQALMRGAFAHAAARGMEICFAYDVDTASANPGELIETLPADARFQVRPSPPRGTGAPPPPVWVANPDTPEGYRYFRTQVEALLAAYPQITTLVVWFRRGSETPWRSIGVDALPPRWREEYAAEIARTPDAAALPGAPSLFAIGKIVRAFQRSLVELGRGDVRIAAGSWSFEFLDAAHRFFPPEVRLMPLDYAVLDGRSQLATAEARAVIRRVAAHRPVVPIVWAHHDDGRYVGRPFTPFDGFQSRLDDAAASGFGIIHWTTRPLDLYFASLAEQVWAGTKDRPLRATCDDLAEGWFGPMARRAMGDYLARWIEEAPIFGRETGPQFIDRPLAPAAEIAAGVRARLALLDGVAPASLTPEQRARLDYFRGQENFAVAVHGVEEALHLSQARLKAGDLPGARGALCDARPEEVIARFATFTSLDGGSRSEQGLVVSLNTRWLPVVVAHRQALGIEPARYNFAPTSHDPLAQGRGTGTYHFDASRQLWQTLGAEETGATTVSNPAAVEEIARGRIESPTPLHLNLGPIAPPAPGRLRFPPGRCRVTLLLADPESTAPGQRVFDVEAADRGTPQRQRIDVFQLAGARGKLVEYALDAAVGPNGRVEIVFTPVHGKVVLSGVVLDCREPSH